MKIRLIEQKPKDQFKRTQLKRALEYIENAELHQEEDTLYLCIENQAEGKNTRNAGRKKKEIEPDINLQQLVKKIGVEKTSKKLNLSKATIYRRIREERERG